MMGERHPRPGTPVQVTQELLVYTMLPFVCWGVIPPLTGPDIVQAAPLLEQAVSAGPVVWTVALFGLGLVWARTGPVGVVGYALVHGGALLLVASPAYLWIGIIGGLAILVGLLSRQWPGSQPLHTRRANP